MRTVEYYLEKGFALPYAEYFANGRKSIVKATANDDFSVTLEFDNGERRRLDMKPTLKQGGVFESFNDISNFRRVSIDDANALCWDIDPDIDSEKVWTNKVDISPEYCYVESKPI